MNMNVFVGSRLTSEKNSRADKLVQRLEQGGEKPGDLENGHKKAFSRFSLIG